MSEPPFRVKRYNRGKYRFLVRGKVRGQWRCRYFGTEGEAIAFSEQQNARARQENGDASPQGEGALKTTEFASPWLPEKPQPKRLDSPEDLSKLAFSTYLGPRLKRYLGDSWCMHLPFAYDLMRELAPTVFVELGVKQGESYFAFCQSALENKIKVRCYGVDSWRGDMQTGNLDPEIQQEVAAYNSRYSSFSELRTTFFAEAVKDFPDAAIDLLHIDGTHTYADVKSDFESWLPKLSQNGVILFHDVMLRGRGFGVWKLWQEITRKHNSFLFEFGCGLGVWKREPVGQGDSSLVRRLLGADKAEARRLNEYYANAAAALALWQSFQRLSAAKNQIAQIKAEAEERTQQGLHLQHKIEEKAKHVVQLQRDLEEKSRQISRLQRDLKEKSSQIAHFQRQRDQELLDRLQGLIRDSERTSHAY